MPCTSSCPTQDHKSWGECARSKNLHVGYCGQGGGDATAQKKQDSELALYREARAQGIQPDGTTRDKIEAALQKSNDVGAAYGRDFSVATPMKEPANG